MKKLLIITLLFVFTLSGCGKQKTDSSAKIFESGLYNDCEYSISQTLTANGRSIDELDKESGTLYETDYYKELRFDLTGGGKIYVHMTDSTNTVDVTYIPPQE